MYNKIKAALKETGIPFADVAWDSCPSSDYGTIMIDSAAGAHWADGHMVGQTLEANLQLFCHSVGYDQMLLVQGALNSVDNLSWYLSSVQFEDSTKLTHWEWILSWPN